MSEEFVPAVEEHPPGLKAFLEETKKLEEPEKAAAPEPSQGASPESGIQPGTAPEVAAPEPKVEPEPPKKEETGFIQDWTKATPEDFQKRISYLYAKDKENGRQWAEAKELLKKTREENEQLRAKMAAAELARKEAGLDDLQAKAVAAFNQSNPEKGAELLRELTAQEKALASEQEAEKKRQEDFKAESTKEASEVDRNIQETKVVLDTWAEAKPYAKPDHPLYPKVVAWIKQAYEKAPPEVTVQQIVQRAEQIFEPLAKTPEPKVEAKPEPSLAPGANGEKLTVSAVLGTQTGVSRTPQTPADKLTQRQREVALKLFHGPGVTKEQAYAEYAKGL